MRRRFTCSLLTSAFLLAGCHSVHLPDYSEAEETQFRADEVKDLTSSRGDLALVHSGLLESNVTIGNGVENNVPLKNWSGPSLTLSLHDASIAVDKAEGNALLEDKPLTVGQTLPLAQLAKQWITNGGISLRIHSEGKGAWMQAFDAKSEPLQTFHPLRYYAPTATYRVAAEWVPLPKGYNLTYHRTNGGNDLATSAPGYIQFALNGTSYKLYATTYPDMLFVVFRDLTSKTETYPAARYLEIKYDSRAFDPAHPFDATKPTKMMLDFNQAVNPACAYNPNTHCPIAPPENRLAVAIPAGEKRYHDE